jgi:hypothetical protein
MRLMVRRKACRCSQSRPSSQCPSPPSVGWTGGVVASGYCDISGRNSTNAGAVSAGTKSCILEQSPASVLHVQGQQDRFLGRDSIFEEKNWGFGTSWRVMKLSGKMLCRCIASVILPEHVAPL